MLQKDIDLKTNGFWILYYSMYSQKECWLTQCNELLHHYHQENIKISKGDHYNTSVSHYSEDSEKVCYDWNNFSHTTDVLPISKAATSVVLK